MVNRRLFVSLCLTLVIVSDCWGQRAVEGSGEDSQASIPNVLRKARVSASLAYWGTCPRSAAPRPDLPAVRLLPESSPGRSPVEALREMFADDPKMQVTQDADGMIRMFESDVPRDLLELRISHISFKDPEGWNGVWHPREARRLLMRTPEVSSFMRAFNIGWASDGAAIDDVFGGPSPELPHVSGDLYNVTLAEALDYVLKSFPGFWVYENCQREDGKRVVFFEIFGSMLKRDKIEK